MASISERENREIEAANASGNTPVHINVPTARLDTIYSQL